VSNLRYQCSKIKNNHLEHSVNPVKNGTVSKIISPQIHESAFGFADFQFRQCAPRYKRGVENGLLQQANHRLQICGSGVCLKIKSIHSIKKIIVQDSKQKSLQRWGLFVFS
jgi:hypothetical protein